MSTARFPVNLMTPPRSWSPFIAVFDDVIRLVTAGLESLGCQVVHTEGTLLLDMPRIVLAPSLSTLASLRDMPSDTIFYNWEQLRASDEHVTKDVRDFLSTRIVWDYSLSNIALWQSMGARNVSYVPFGFHESLVDRTMTSGTPAWDILFYGTFNSRRERILHEIADLGVSIRVLSFAFGAERAQHIAQARMVLSLHAFDGACVLEQARMGPLWASGIPVLSEVNDTTDVPFGAREWALHAPVEAIPQLAAQLLSHPGELEASAHHCRTEFEHRSDITDHLRAALVSAASAYQR